MAGRVEDTARLDSRGRLVMVEPRVGRAVVADLNRPESCRDSGRFTDIRSGQTSEEKAGIAERSGNMAGALVAPDDEDRQSSIQDGRMFQPVVSRSSLSTPSTTRSVVTSRTALDGT